MDAQAIQPLPSWEFGDFGFTGTRKGMTKDQARQFMLFIMSNGDSVRTFHHGDAVGADAQAHELMKQVLPLVKRYGYPSNIFSQCAHSQDFYWYDSPKPPLERNDLIIKACQVLVACPGEEQEVLRSGTWSTIRKAMKSRLVVICYPSGRVQMNEEFGQDQGKRMI